MTRKHHSKRSSIHGYRSHRSRNRIVAGVLLVILAAIATAVFFFINFNKDRSSLQPNAPSETAFEITVLEAYYKYEQGVFFLDVREQEEWDAFHIPNITLIPLGELPERINELPKGQEIVVVCRSGNRSQAGRDTLLQAGFTNVTSMAGGVTEWSDAGYPIEGLRP